MATAASALGQSTHRSPTGKRGSVISVPSYQVMHTFAYIWLEVTAPNTRNSSLWGRPPAPQPRLSLAEFPGLFGAERSGSRHQDQQDGGCRCRKKQYGHAHHQSTLQGSLSLRGRSDATRDAAIGHKRRSTLHGHDQQRLCRRVPAVPANLVPPEAEPCYLPARAGGSDSATRHRRSRWLPPLPAACRSDRGIAISTPPPPPDIPDHQPPPPSSCQRRGARMREVGVRVAAVGRAWAQGYRLRAAPSWWAPTP
jgi:hypothetical protein